MLAEAAMAANAAGPLLVGALPLAVSASCLKRAKEHRAHGTLAAAALCPERIPNKRGQQAGCHLASRGIRAPPPADPADAATPGHLDGGEWHGVSNWNRPPELRSRIFR